MVFKAMRAEMKELKEIARTTDNEKRYNSIKNNLIITVGSFGTLTGGALVLLFTKGVVQDIGAVSIPISTVAALTSSGANVFIAAHLRRMARD
jgi:hypothetical protein